jgi:hypothetical protein
MDSRYDRDSSGVVSRNPNLSSIASKSWVQGLDDSSG